MPHFLMKWEMEYALTWLFRFPLGHPYKGPTLGPGFWLDQVFPPILHRLVGRIGPSMD